MLLLRKLLLSGVVLSVLLCSSLVVSADAASKWSQTYGGTGNEVAYSLVATSDGGYAMAGCSGSLDEGYDVWLVKTDSNGVMEWNRTYGGRAYSLVVTSDGGYALAGGSMLIKTDALGNMQWNKTYGGAEWAWTEASSLIATTDGGYAIAGTAYSVGGGGEDFWLVKTDALGNMQWGKTYGGAAAVHGDSDYAYSLVAASDGGYAIAGMTWFSKETGEDYDFWLVKTDALGNVQWNQTYGGMEARSLVVTSDGGYAMAGTTGSEFMLVKTDAHGNMQWSKTYTGYDSAWAYSLVTTSDGGYAMAGGTASIRSSTASLLLVKIDVSGNMQWNRTYTGGMAYSLVKAPDGGYAIAGKNHNDFWLVKTDESGVIPEYPPWVIPSLMLTATAFIIINKKRLSRTR